MDGNDHDQQSGILRGRGEEEEEEEEEGVRKWRQ